MQYVLLIYEDENIRAQMNASEQQKMFAEYAVCTDEMRKDGVYVAGEALHATSAATTVRVRQGKTLTTDGPFAETREQIGGFYILDCKDMDEAI